jgi:hypothetical protein
MIKVQRIFSHLFTTDGSEKSHSRTLKIELRGEQRLEMSIGQRPSGRGEEAQGWNLDV